MFTAKLTYFKETGKYYSEGEYDSSEDELYKIWREVRKMQREGTLPGLTPGSKFHVLVKVPGHPHDHPTLMLIEGSVAPTFTR